jgi:hypothetical protein
MDGPPAFEESARAQLPRTKENAMNRIAKRLTYANVISTIALFLVLGGASALAATQLAKSSVGSKQLKNGAVTTAKIRDGAVTGAKIRDGSLSGAKLDLGSLGQVPSAATATSAAHATSADNASTVGGQAVQKISWVAPKGTPATTIFSGVGLAISGTCSAAGEIFVTATTTAPDAEIQIFGNEGGSFFDSENSSFEAPASLVNGGGKKEGGGSFAYGTASGSVATMTYGFDYPKSFHLKNDGCAFFGQIVYG